MIEVIFYICCAVLLFAAGVGFWALGQWLRSKGLGSRLDRVNHVLAPVHVRTAREIGQEFGRSMRLDNVERISRARKRYIQVINIVEE